MNNNNKNSETVSLILGIISLFTFWLGIVLGVLAIIIGNKVRKETNKMPPGMILGIISVSIYSLFTIIIIAIYIFAYLLGV